MGKIFEKIALAFKRMFSSLFKIFKKKENPVPVKPEIPAGPREIIKEVPVEVIKEVVKEVKVEVPVEVVKEVIKEVKVEVPVEVIKEVPVLVEPKPVIGPKPGENPVDEKQPEMSDPLPPPNPPVTEVKYDSSDIARLMAQWGRNYEPFDFNKDGTIDGADLGILLNKLSERMSDPKEFEILCPHHEVMHDKWLGPADKNIFYQGSMEPTLRKEMGVRKYFLFYPSFNFAEDYANKKINVDLIAEHVRKDVGEDFEGYGMLDYEGGFFKDLDKGEGSKENQVITQVMVDALHQLKKMFPKMKWSYYGIPKVPYWLPDPKTGQNWLTWATAPQELKDSIIDYYVNAYKELLLHCDYMNPSLYNRYDPTDPEVQKYIPKFEETEYEYRKAAALIAKKVQEVNKTNIPILPMFCHTYAVGGDVEYPGKLVQRDFMDRCVFKPFLDVGVNGFMYWNAIHYYAWEALPTDNTRPSLNSGAAFCKNFGYESEQSKIPWARGSGPEEIRSYWRDKYVECYNSVALKYIQIAKDACMSHR